MNLSSFEWQTKQSHRSNRTEHAGRQIILDFGLYHLSIIDDGHGREDGLYEIAVYLVRDNVPLQQLEMPGITWPGDTVKGNLTEADVNDIINKLYWMSATVPEQI